MSKQWKITLHGGASYFTPSEAETYEDFRADAMSFLGFSEERYQEFEIVLDLTRCGPDE